MANRKFTPKPGLCAATNAKLAKLHVCAIQISRRKRVNAQQFIDGLRELCEITETVFAMAEVTHG